MKKNRKRNRIRKRKRKCLNTQEEQESQHTGRARVSIYRKRKGLDTQEEEESQHTGRRRVQGLAGRSCSQGCLPEVQAWTWPFATKSALGSPLSEHLLQMAATQLFRHITFHHSCSGSRLITDPNIQRCVFHKLFGTASMQAFAQ